MGVLHVWGSRASPEASTNTRSRYASCVTWISSPSSGEPTDRHVVLLAMCNRSDLSRGIAYEG